MQTIYYKTSHFIQHSGNLVDLGEYRRRLALAQTDSLARKPEQPVWSQEEEPAFRPVVLPNPPARRHSRCRRRAWALDVCASLSVVLMTLAFVLRVML